MASRVRSAACYDDALAEAGECGQSVGAALDHLDLVDDAFGVAVGGRLVELREQLRAPQPDAVSECAEGRNVCATDGAQERVEPSLGLETIGGPIDRAEGFLQAPRLGDQRLVREELAELPALMGGEPVACLEQSVAGVKEVLAPTGLAALPGSLRAAGACRSLAFAPDCVQGGVRAADEVEVIDDDPRPRQLGPDRLAVGVVWIDRDDLDRATISFRESLQIALNDASAAAVEDITTRRRSRSETTVASSCPRRCAASSSDRRRGGRRSRRACSSSEPTLKARATW